MPADSTSPRPPQTPKVPKIQVILRTISDEELQVHVNCFSLKIVFSP